MSDNGYGGWVLRRRTTALNVILASLALVLALLLAGCGQNDEQTPASLVLTPDHTPASVASDGPLGAVAYVKDGNLLVLNLDTSDDRVVAHRDVALTYGTTAQSLTAFNPEWSVDGQWIAFNIINGVQPSAFRSPYLVRASDGLLELGGSNSGR